MRILPTVCYATMAIISVLAVVVRVIMLECKNMTFPEQSPSKIILITGANSGLGYYTALRLAQLKAHVVLACRSTDKCAAARQSILDLHPEALVDAMQLDLSSFESIRMFSTTFNKSYESLDVLVNNAGIMALPTRETTKDGLEAQIGTNHFGHYLLTCLLFPKLTANGRIINHASGAHLFHAEGFPFENAQMETGYSAWTAYGNSKVANLLFTFELNRRLSGRNISAYAVHPGYTATNLQTGRFPLHEWANYLAAMKGEDGALSQILAAVGDVQPSMYNYIGPKYQMFGAPAVQATARVSLDDAAAAKLWEISTNLTGADIQF